MNDWWYTTAQKNACAEFVQNYETVDEYVTRTKAKVIGE